MALPRPAPEGGNELVDVDLDERFEHSGPFEGALGLFSVIVRAEGTHFRQTIMNRKNVMLGKLRCSGGTGGSAAVMPSSFRVVSPRSFLPSLLPDVVSQQIA